MAVIDRIRWAEELANSLQSLETQTLMLQPALDSMGEPSHFSAERG
jgi:hypothetical protein